MNWDKLLNNTRRKDKHKSTETEEKPVSDSPEGVQKPKDSRVEFERDYDRILFLAPTRRLADKTQVFPLEQNDSVRNRLTHSHEVCNLARSVGVQLAYEHAEIFDGNNLSERGGNITRCLPSLLAAIGLAHDLGNPPFGHRGENAIQEWFKKSKESKFNNILDSEAFLLDDFLNFDGNAQTLRLVTKLQILNDKFGVNLTYGTLAAMIKYPQSNQSIEDSNKWEKHGFFYSESDIVDEIWQETSLAEGLRHPLTYVMEACDDIAYSVLDAEDIVKKGLASFQDLMSHLEYWCNTPSLHKSKSKGKTQQLELIRRVIKESQKKHNEFAKPDNKLTPSELNDVSMQMFRVAAIGELITAVTDAFTDNIDSLIVVGSQPKDLISLCDGHELCAALKNFDFKWGYRNNSVLKLELQGYNYITKLMDMLWIGIHGRLDEKNPRDSNSFFGEYAYGRISENYRRVFEDTDNNLPNWYKEAQLLTDAISGMTDSYLISLHDELLGLFTE